MSLPMRFMVFIALIYNVERTRLSLSPLECWCEDVVDRTIRRVGGCVEQAQGNGKRGSRVARRRRRNASLLRVAVVK